jgi:hypothetical protein
MSRQNRVLGAFLVMLLLAAVVGAGIADAKKRKFHGAVTMSYEKNPNGTDRFFGTVTSPNQRCVRGAVVNLGFKPAFEGGGGSGDTRTTVATTRSDANGNWEMFYEVTPNPAYDFASFSASSPVRPLKSKKPGVKLVCKFQTSEVKTIYPGPSA